MLSLGIKTFVRRLWQNLFIALQLAITLILTIQIVSSVLSRINLYMPIKHYLDGNGIVVGCYSMPLGSKETILETYDGVTDVYGSYCSDLSYSPSGDLNSDSFYDAEALDKNYIELNSPEMKSGVWLSEADLSGRIKAVVTESTYGFKTGDIIKAMYRPLDSDEPFTQVDVEIIGVIKDDSPIFGLSEAIYNDTKDFRDLYAVNNKKTNPLPMLITAKEQLDEYNIPNSFSKNVILKLDDKVSEKDIQTMSMHLNEFNYTMSLSEFNFNSQKYITEEITRLLPLLICIFILLLISSASLTGLSVKSQLRSYSVYYVLGAKWNECIKINFISNLITSLIAVVITFTTINVIFISKLWSETVIRIGTWQILACVIVIVFNLIVSLILPIGIMHRNTPKEILTSNE